MKKFLCNLLLLWLVAFSCYAQNHVVKGRVTDERGDPLPGVTVSLKGGNARTATGQDGTYSLNIPPKTQPEVLVYSFIGYQTKELEAKGLFTLDVKMDITVTKDLTEIVVTALNIPREKKSLGYAMQGVSVKDMTEARATNITDLLDGKVAGLQITTSGQPTGSTRVLLRGAGSITGNNQPLWVVDGVPIDNNDSNGQVGNLDYGNNAADLNPDDIESIEVLKGPNAAALYGSKAANGAILVTTKKGKKNSGWGLSYNGNYLRSQVLQFPAYQYEYGEGSNGRFSGTLVGPPGQGIIQAGTGGGRNWGGPLFGEPYLAVNGQQITYSPQQDVVNSLFQKGYQSSQNVALSNADDKSAVRFSYTRGDATDVIQKQNQVRKNNFQLNISRDFTPRIKVESRIQYIQETVTNRTYRNEDPANPFNYFNQAVLSIPLSSLIPWKAPNGNAFNAGGNSNLENPYWDINENGNQDTHNNIIGGVTATIKILDGLSFRAQESGNLYWGNRYTFIQKGSLSNINGQYSEFQQNNQVWNSEGLFSYNKRLHNFSIVANLGGNLRYTNYYNTSATANQLLVHDVRALSNNASVIIANENFLKSQVNSVYGLASIGYKDFLYVEATGRNDWSSTLPPKNASFFYPSVSGSFVFTELWKDIPKSILSFGKLRASIAKVGNDTSPFNLYNSFITSNVFNGVSFLSFESQLKNSNLKPEQTTSTEIGLELHFLDNRLTLDGDVYKSKTVNQLLTPNTPAEFGYSSQVINAGEVQNKGIELTLSGTPIKTKDFSWDAVYNFSLNRNKVVSLTSGITSVLLGRTGTVFNYAEVGQPLGILRGENQVYDAKGNAIIDPVKGIPIYTTQLANNTPVIIGYASPKAIMSFGSTVRYKEFSFNFLASARIGGNLYAGTNSRNFTSGGAAETLTGRDQWLFSDGVLGENDNERKGITSILNKPYPNGGRIQGAIWSGYFPLTDASGKPVFDANGNYIADLTKPNNIYISPQTYWQQTGHVSHLYTYDASYVKLSQVILTYAIPSRWLRGSVFRSAQISAVGRNIWTIFQKTPKGIDPESAAFSGNAQGIEQGGSLPYATYGIDFKVSL